MQEHDTHTPGALTAAQAATAAAATLTAATPAEVADATEWWALAAGVAGISDDVAEGHRPVATLMLLGLRYAGPHAQVRAAHAYAAGVVAALAAGAM